MESYVTTAGDTWDIIARRVYGDELRADRLMAEKANFPVLDYEVFPSGVTVFVPETAEDGYSDEDLPEWRRET